MFRWDWQPEPAAQAALDEIAAVPANRRVPWLKLVWEPGEIEEPVQRWFIYEMLPPAQLLKDRSAASRFHTSELFKVLEGPPPRSLRSWKELEGKWRWVSESPVTQLQWDLWHETGCFGMPFWIVQGIWGGHKRWFNHIEQRVLRLHRHSASVPPPGALPFAEWDNRTVSALAEQRRLREVFDALGNRDLEVSTALDHRVKRSALAKQTGIELLAWLDRQIAAGVDESKHLWRTSDLPTSDSAAITDQQMEQAEQEFVEYFALPEENR